MPAARTCSSMPSSIVARRPAAKIATNTTSATPIISAEAVTAVRCGWRRAFSRGEMAGETRSAPAACRSTALSGRTSVGASSAKPNIISTAPRPSSEAVALAVAGIAEQRVQQDREADELDQPRRRGSGACAAARCRAWPPRASPRPARRAWRGAPGRSRTRAWRSRRRARPTMIVRVLEPDARCCRARGRTRRTARAAPGAISRPSAMPMIDATEADHERSRRSPSVST